MRCPYALRIRSFNAQQTRKLLVERLTAVPRHIATLLAVAIGTGFLACLNSVSLPVSLAEWGHSVLWITGTIAVSALSASPNFRLLALYSLLLTASFVTLRPAAGIAAVLYTGQGELLQDWWLPFANPGFVSQALVWTLPLLSIVRLLPLGKRKAIIGNCCSVFSVTGFMMMFWAGGRGAIGAILVAMVIAFAVTRDETPYRSPTFLILLHLIAGALLSVAVRNLLTLVTQSAYQGEALIRPGLSLRDVLWQRALDMVLANPLLGEGPGHFAIFDGPDFLAAHPHNLILQLASEWGLPAAISFVFIWINLIRTFAKKLSSARQTDESPEQLATGEALLITVIGASVLAMFDGVLVMPWSTLLGAIVCGMSIHWSSNCSKITLQSSGASVPADALLKGFAAIAVTASIATCWGGWTLRSCHELNNTDKTTSHRYLNPRFWLDGRLSPEQSCFR